MPIIDNEVLPGHDYPLDDLPRISLGKWIRTIAEENFAQYGDATWITDVSTGSSLTYSQLLGNMRKIASALWKRGLRLGNSVLLMTANFVELPLAYISVLQCGGVATAVTLNLTPSDIRFRCEQTKPKFAIVDSVRAPRVVQALKDLDVIQEVFVMHGHCQGCTDFDELLKDTGDQFPENPDVDPESAAIIWFSSGTTGLAKAIVMDHFACRRSDVTKWQSGGKPAFYQRKFMFINPIINAGGIANIFIGTMSHAPLMILSDYSDDNLLKAINQYKPEIVSLFPTQIVWICKHVDLAKYDLSSVKILIYGGSCLNPFYETEISKKLPGVLCLTSYGMSESGTITTNARITDKKVGKASSSFVPGSCGRVVPNFRLKILNENGEKLGPGQEGHVVFKGPGFMKEYLNNPEATAELLRDGWCYSGDCGYFDEAGNVYITGRFKELIKYRMAHVVPANIEKHLLTHPAVAEAVVVGLPDDLVGELPTACIVKRPGYEVTEQEIIQMIDDLVPDEERLRGGVRFVDHIPRKDWGKPVRRLLIANITN